MGGFTSGMAISDMAAGIEKTAMSTTHRLEMELATADFLESQRVTAELASEMAALRAALAKFDSNHPMLVDENLRKSMRNAGRAKFNESKDHSWPVIARASDSIKYSYTPPVQSDSQKEKLAELESANIQNHVEKHALRAALKRMDKNHPLVRPDPDQNMLVAALRRAGLMAYSFGGYDGVAEAGRTFKYPENMLWGQRSSVLESYPGELEALEKRVEFLRNPQNQQAFLRLQQQASKAPG